MRLNLIKRSARHRARVDAAVTGYTQWRSECTAVRNAYRQWVAAGLSEEAFAFNAYNDALDREEHAAKRYARLIGRARQIPEMAAFDLAEGRELLLSQGCPAGPARARPAPTATATR